LIEDFNESPLGANEVDELNKVLVGVNLSDSGTGSEEQGKALVSTDASDVELGHIGFLTGIEQFTQDEHFHSDTSVPSISNSSGFNPDTLVHSIADSNEFNPDTSVHSVSASNGIGDQNTTTSHIHGEYTAQSAADFIWSMYTHQCDCRAEGTERHLAKQQDEDTAIRDTPVAPQNTSLQEITREWQKTIQTDCLTVKSKYQGRDLIHGFAPLDQDDHTTCRGRTNDIIPQDAYRTLLCEPTRLRPVSLAASELAHKQLADVEQSSDIDSVMAPLSSLAAHKGGISLSCRPLITYQLKGAQYILINGKDLQKTKHMRLCQGMNANGYRYTTYVFFPDIKGTKTMLPTDDELAIWTDDVLLPSIHDAYSDAIT
jgi:hypothetical protein